MPALDCLSNRFSQSRIHLLDSCMRTGGLAICRGIVGSDMRKPDVMVHVVQHELAPIRERRNHRPVQAGAYRQNQATATAVGWLRPTARIVASPSQPPVGPPAHAPVAHDAPPAAESFPFSGI